jgi:NADPH-dependent curcumin reductase CurA
MDNRCVVLRERPVGVPRPEFSALETRPANRPGPGALLGRNLFLSVDPAKRGWVTMLRNIRRRSRSMGSYAPSRSEKSSKVGIQTVA